MTLLDDLRAELAAMRQERDGRVENERIAFSRLSRALTGGNAATWEQVFDAADHHEKIVLLLREQRDLAEARQLERGAKIAELAARPGGRDKIQATIRYAAHIWSLEAEAEQRLRTVTQELDTLTRDVKLALGAEYQAAIEDGASDCSVGASRGDRGGYDEGMRVDAKR